MTVPALNRNGLNLVASRPMSAQVAFGPKGDPGPQGEVGPPGPMTEADVQALLAASRYDHPQPTPATTWTVNHNLGRPISATVYSVGGLELEAEVVTVSPNQIQVLFTIATAGSAVIT